MSDLKFPPNGEELRAAIKKAREVAAEAKPSNAIPLFGLLNREGPSEVLKTAYQLADKLDKLDEVTCNEHRRPMCHPCTSRFVDETERQVGNFREAMGLVKSLKARLAQAQTALEALWDHYETDAGGVDHDDGCPMDDTCDCSVRPLLDQINAACSGSSNWLAEHDRAIREECAKVAEADLDRVHVSANCGRNNGCAERVADAIRALSSTKPGGDSDV